MPPHRDRRQDDYGTQEAPVTENLGAIIVAIRQRGGSVSMPMSAELRDLANRHLLYGTEGPKGTFSWSLVPGVVKWLEERGE